jgi:hypothetical protein
MRQVSVRRLGVRISAAVAAAAAVVLVLGPGTAFATAHRSSGPVTLYVYGAGLYVSSSETTEQSPCGPWAAAQEWSSNGQYYAYGQSYIGNICLAETLGFTFGSWTASGDTTLYGEWYAGDFWLSEYEPYVNIIS